MSQARIPFIIQLLPNFLSIRDNLPSGMCIPCNSNKFLKMEKGIPVSRPEIYWNELAEHVSIKKALSKDTVDDPCDCEICKVRWYFSSQGLT